MAIDRNYQAPDFGVRDTEQVAAPQVAQSDNRVTPVQNVGDSQWAARLVQGLGGKIAGDLDNFADISRQNLYLKGQADVGLIHGENEIDGNPLTRDWEVAGYQDTMGKLALADQQAQFATDLTNLRQGSPQQMQDYLDQRREKFAPVLASMSLAARAASAGQMLLQDKSAISTYTGEHIKFVIDQKSQAVNTSNNVQIKGLVDSQLAVSQGSMSMDAYRSQIKTAAGTFVGGVWADPTLPIEVKRNLTAQYAQQALDSDQVDLYDYLNNNMMGDQKDGASTLISRLNGDQQMTVANAYRSAMQRTNDQRSIERFAQLGQIKSSIATDTFTDSYENLHHTLAQMVINKTIPGTELQSIEDSFAQMQYKKGNQVVLADAARRGDYQSIENTPGGSPEKAMTALDATLQRQHADPTTRLSTYLTAGANGFQEAYKAAGTQLDWTIGAISTSTDGKVLPQHIQVFQAINAADQAAKAKGDNTVRSKLLSGMSEGNRMFAAQVFGGLDDKKSLDEALQAARTSMAEDAKLSPSMKSAKAQTNSTAVNAAVDGIDSRGLFSSAWLGVKAMFGSQAAADTLKLEPSNGVNSADGYFSTSPTVQFYADAAREAVRARASQVMASRPGATPAQVVQVARADVAARTIDVQGQGPLIMPDGVNLQTTFGVAPNNQAAIGSAIGSMLKPASPSGRFQVSFANGQLYAQEVDVNNNRVGNGMFISGDQIKAKISADMKAQTDDAHQIYGAGKLVNSHGVNVQYSGNNVAGAPQDWMLGLRDNLVQQEGIRNQEYMDTVGTKTNGVGVAYGNPHYPTPGPDGKVSDQAVSDSFNAASDDAAKAGLRVATTMGRQNQPTFLLMSELAYQSGVNFMGQGNSTGAAYRSLGSAIVSGDVTKAQDAFKQTKTYEVSGADRRTHYLNLVAQAAQSKGN